VRLAPIVARHIVKRVVEGILIDELPGQPVGQGHWPDDLPFAADRAYRGRRFPGNDTDCVGVFGEPMAYAIIGGLFVPTLLTLLLLPALSIKEPVKERQVGARDRAPSAAL
jgi:hypothetical protein